MIRGGFPLGGGWVEGAHGGYVFSNQQGQIYDRAFVKQQERIFNTVFCKWLIYARLTPQWNQGVYLEMGRGIIQTMRDAYWRARRVDVELVHLKLEKDVRPEDKFYHHVSDQLADRQKQYARYQSFAGSPPALATRPSPGQTRPTGFPQRRTFLCFGCRSPDHMWRNCPKRFQQDFRARVAGPAPGSKSL